LILKDPLGHCCARLRKGLERSVVLDAPAPRGSAAFDAFAFGGDGDAGRWRTTLEGALLTRSGHVRDGARVRVANAARIHARTGIGAFRLEVLVAGWRLREGGGGKQKSGSCE
jgi:hypothetical protein